MKTITLALVLGLFVALVLIHMVQSDASSSSQAKQTKASSDGYAGPIVDYDKDYQATAAASPKERALRVKRGQRYNDRAPDPLGDLPYNWEDFGISSDWYILLPAFPVAQSDAVIVGEVTGSEAHLSNDKTGVYSEFTIRIDEVLKNHLNTTLNVGAVTVGERERGIVRFQGGRLLRYVIFHQGMPRPGRKYLFFLSHNKQGEDYAIVTAYEFRRGHVVALDESEVFASYNGSDEQEFLNQVRQAIARGQQTPKERKEEK